MVYKPFFTSNTPSIAPQFSITIDNTMAWNYYRQLISPISIRHSPICSLFLNCTSLLSIASCISIRNLAANG